MSIQKIVIGFIVIAIILSFAVFPGYAQSQGKGKIGGDFQGQSNNQSEEMLRLREEERKQIREKSKELGKEVMEKKMLEKRERAQIQEQKEKMFQQFDSGRNSGERRTSPGRGGRGR